MLCRRNNAFGQDDIAVKPPFAGLHNGKALLGTLIKGKAFDRADARPRADHCGEFGNGRRHGLGVTDHLHHIGAVFDITIERQQLQHGL